MNSSFALNLIKVKRFKKRILSSFFLNIFIVKLFFKQVMKGICQNV